MRTRHQRSFRAAKGAISRRPGGEEDARALRQRRGRGVHVGDRDEAVLRRPLERRAQQLHARHAGLLRRLGRMRGDLRGEGMRRVDQRVVALVLQERREPVRPAEAAAPHASRADVRQPRQPGERGDRLEPVVAGEPRGKLGRLRRAAEDQQPSHVRSPPARARRGRRSSTLTATGAAPSTAFAVSRALSGDERGERQARCAPRARALPPQCSPSRSPRRARSVRARASREARRESRDRPPSATNEGRARPARASSACAKPPAMVSFGIGWSRRYLSSPPAKSPMSRSAMSGRRVARAHRLLRRVAGRARDMVEPGGARDVDAAVDRMDPRGAGERHDDAGRAEDRKPADDAEPRVPGLLRERLAARDGDLDLGVRQSRRARPRPRAIASVIILRGTGLIAGSPGGIGRPGKRHGADARPGLEAHAGARRAAAAPSRRSPR